MTATTSSSSSTTAAATPPTGIAGRTDYGKWDRLASDLADESEAQSAAEAADASKALGHTSHPRSQAEADELVKSAEVRKAKAALDGYRRREEGTVQVLSGLLGPTDPNATDPNPTQTQPTQPQPPAADESPPPTTRYVTRNLLDAGRRVLSVTDSTGPGTIVLTEDLSNLASAVPANNSSNPRLRPKSYDGDAENDVVEEVGKEGQTQQATGQTQPAAGARTVHGLIKLNLSHLANLTVIIKCKIITGTVDVSHCHNLRVRIESDATIATVQADLCTNLDLEFRDAPSGTNPAVDALGRTVPTSVFWGDDDADGDRVYHAGVSGLRVATYRDGFLDLETRADYGELGATAVGNATAEEVQFVTGVVGGTMRTERVVRPGSGVAGPSGAGSSSVSSARPMTEREVEEMKKRRESAPSPPEGLIRFVEKNKKEGEGGGVGDEAAAAASSSSSSVASPTSVADRPESADDDDVEEEVYASMSKAQIDAVVTDCESHKAKGNEAFGSGEYAQAVLHYTLALDRAAELPDSSSSDDGAIGSGREEGPAARKVQLFPRHVVLSNRSAAFLKLGEHEKALRDAEDATTRDPTYVKAAFRRGLALHALGRYEEAVPALGGALKIEPKNKQIRQALQFAEVRMQQEMRRRMEG